AVTLPGRYQYANGEIVIHPVSTLTFFPEKSVTIKTFMGMIVYFTTFIDDISTNPSKDLEMECVAVGHRYNDQSQEAYRSFTTCDPQKFQTLTYDNSIEFTSHSSIHTNMEVPGAIFRQREWLGQQNITRGYGIYRRVGRVYYAYFGTRFNDANLLKGEIGSTEQSVSVPQLGFSCRR
ncbi:MAG: hypothetical protein ACE5FU_11180, partial [Nitrospinota bacterium]